ncbi:MAG: hypothetical protein NVS1B13_18040 [Flavisolibacter sp.]
MKHIVLLFLIIFSGQIQAQLLVSKEPHHHVVFENKKARILDVFILPADTTLYHLHAKPSVFIGFTNTKTGSQRKNQQPVESISVSGEPTFENLNPPHTKNHRVWNSDTVAFHVMDIELLAKNPGFLQKPLFLKHLKLVIDTTWVRAYKIQLKKSESIMIKNNQSQFYLVAVNEAKVLIKNKKDQIFNLVPGKFYNAKALEQLNCTNIENKPANFVLFEVR